MKILVINGSPRGERSNTLRLTRAFTRRYGITPVRYQKQVTRR